MEEKIRRALGKGQKKERRLQQIVNAHRTGLWVYGVAISFQVLTPDFGVTTLLTTFYPAP